MSWDELRREPDPRLPKPPQVRIRAIGSRFRHGGRPVADGEVVRVDVDLAAALVRSGKAVRVE